jgi:outer membrane receptor protein involved in Fe transport
MTNGAATASGPRCACALLLLLAAAAQVQAAGERLFDIPAQSLETALESLALASDHQLLFWTRDLDGMRSRRLRGNYTIEAALSQLLTGTQLKFEVSAGTIVILPADPESPAGTPQAVKEEPEARPEPVPVTILIEEVIVTARRREEDLQEVPISVTALESTALQERNVGSVLEVNGQAANVAINSDPFSGVAGSQLRMRGIPGVVLYQDGVRAANGALPSTIDVERVEVLRGPQGTLFGRNAIGGAIQTVTRRPQDHLSTRLSLAAGSADRFDVSGTVNVPVTDSFFAKLTASSLTRDGFVSSPYLPTLLGSQKDRLYRADLLWRPAPETEVRVQATRTRNYSSGQANVNFRLDAVCPSDPVPAGYRNGSGEQLFFAPNAYCILSRLDLDPATPGVQPYSTEFHSWRRDPRWNTHCRNGGTQ